MSKENILRRVGRRGENDCWPWNGYRNSLGYGVVEDSPTRKTFRAHRLVYEILVGKIPEGSVLRHRCDNPSCVNPAHLVPGTQAENVADMSARGRSNPPRGRRSPNAKLTDAQIIEIRSSQATLRALAARHGVCHRVIWNIKRRVDWPHVAQAD